MKVEIWSDIACPFCYIGKHHFQKAVDTLFDKDHVEVDWKSFELDPNAKRDYDDDIYTLLANKYNQTREWAINSAENMRAKGNEIGLEFNFNKAISTNTFDAHRLLHLAKSKGLQNEAEEALFEAYFKDGQHIGTYEVIIKVGKKIGLAENEVKAMLNSDMYATEVREDERQGQRFGIRSVPFFVINRKYGISGAQPISHFVDVLKKANEDESTLITHRGFETNTCGIDGCE